MNNRNTAFYKYCLKVLKDQKPSYVTFDSYNNIFNYRTNTGSKDSHSYEFHKIFHNIDNIYPDKGTVVTCQELAERLKVAVKNSRILIDHIESKGTSSRLKYADLIKVPGTDNYRQVFHYEHHLSPIDKKREAEARERIRRSLGTYRLKPDTSAQAPVYSLHDVDKPWSFNLIFVKDVQDRIKRLAD